MRCHFPTRSLFLLPLNSNGPGTSLQIILPWAGGWACSRAGNNFTFFLTDSRAFLDDSPSLAALSCSLLVSQCCYFLTGSLFAVEFKWIGIVPAVSLCIDNDAFAVLDDFAGDASISRNQNVPTTIPTAFSSLFGLDLAVVVEGDIPAGTVPEGKDNTSFLLWLLEAGGIGWVVRSSSLRGRI